MKVERGQCSAEPANTIQPLRPQSVPTLSNCQLCIFVVFCIPLIADPAGQNASEPEQNRGHSQRPHFRPHHLGLRSARAECSNTTNVFSLQVHPAPGFPCGRRFAMASSSPPEPWPAPCTSSSISRTTRRGTKLA